MANTTRNHRPASERRHNRQKPEQEELLFDELSLDPDAKSGAPAEEGLGFEECLVKSTAVAVARCEVDKPWNLDLSRVAELEAEFKDSIEKLE